MDEPEIAWFDKVWLIDVVSVSCNMTNTREKKSIMKTIPKTSNWLRFWRDLKYILAYPN